jgi:hypothetical protein
MAAITAGDIVWKYSVAGAATAGNATAGSAATTWQGKYMSSTAWAGGGTNDLFDDISGAENAASTVDYRCLFIHNSNAANAYQTPVVYLSSEVAGGASIAVAADTTAASAIGSSTAQALAAATSETAPGGTITGLTYSSPTTAAAGVSLGASIGVANCKAFWIRRTAANSAALSADGVTLAVSGDTGSL